MKATSPVKEESQDRTIEIYCKAARIFHDQGYDATSMSDLANALEITKAGLYYYIDSKEDLLFRIINYGLDWLQREVIEPAKKIENAEERLRFVIHQHGGEMIKGVQAIPILTDESSSLPPKLRKQIDKRKRVYFDLVRGTLDELKALGKLNDVDTTVATFSLFGMLLWLPRWYKPNRGLGADETLEQLANLYLGGLLASSTKGRRSR